MPDFTGEQIEFFLTPEGRRKVDEFMADTADEFMADTADESDDFDINEAIDRGNEESVLAMCGYSPEYIAMWRRICGLATDQPHVHPDMDSERFARILSVEKRPSTLDLALICDAFGVTDAWLMTGDDQGLREGAHEAAAWPSDA